MALRLGPARRHPATPPSCYPVIQSDCNMDRSGTPADETGGGRHDELLHYVQSFIQLRPLADRVVCVLAALPAELLADLRRDDGFHLSLEDYQPGRGTKVWMPVGSEVWKESRSVVLRRRLNACREDFALYIIAHEFAHAVLRNGGWGQITDPEQAADALAAQWGFPRPPRSTAPWLRPRD